MDTNEIIALSIVALAALLALRLMASKKNGCCSKDCFKPKEPLAKK